MNKLFNNHPFSQFWEQKKFFRKIIKENRKSSQLHKDLQHHDKIPKGRKDGQTLFYRTLPGLNQCSSQNIKNLIGIMKVIKGREA